MKRLLTLLFLLAGFVAAAQNSPKYEHFKELRDQSDTLGMKRMLDDWGDKDAEYYSAWANYCVVMAETTEDESWLPLSVNWVQMGRDEFPDNELLLLKQAEILFFNDMYQEAFPLLEEIEEKGLGDSSTWGMLSEIHQMRNDFASARKYLEKLARDGDEEERAFALNNLEGLDWTEHALDSMAIHPDHAAIRELAGTPGFQQLTDRFVACDSTLTTDEIATVYYGAAYSQDYNHVSQELEPIQKLADEEKYGEAVDALQELLKTYPVSLNCLISIYNLSEDPELLDAVIWKARMLLNTVISSGRGDSPDRPFQVICINDEYQVLGQVFQMIQFRGQALVEKNHLETFGPMDQMTFLNGNGLEQVVYFALTPPYWERYRTLE